MKHIVCTITDLRGMTWKQISAIKVFWNHKITYNEIEDPEDTVKKNSS